MEHDAPSMSNREATDSLRARRRSASSGSNNKRTRLGGHGTDSNHHAHDNSHDPSNTQPVPASASGPSPPVAYFTDSNSTGYLASRPAEHASQRFPASTLRHPQPYNPSPVVIPPGWGPQTRSTSFPSPPLVSPLTGSPYPRRDSAYSTGVPRTSSPSASSNSSRGEDGRLAYAPMRAPDQNSTASSTRTPTFGVGHQYATNANGFAAPFPPAHRGPTANTDDTSSSRHGPGSLTNIVDGFRATPPASAHNKPPVSFAEAEPRLPFTADAVIRHVQQDVGKISYSQTLPDLGRGTFSPAFGAWTRSHHGDSPNTQQAVPQPPRPTSSFPPAAPLHNILHPVDQTPSVRHADVTGRPGSDSQRQHSSSSSSAPSAVSSAAPTNVFSHPPTFPPNDISPSGDEAPPTAKTGNEIQIAPSISREESEDNQRRQERRSRSTFSVDQRNETSKTRAIGACLRCKSQRVRCIPSPLGPLHPCLTCDQVSNNSKKVLHEIRCVRWRMIAMTTYRSGGLRLTRRWDGTAVQDVGDWANIKTYEIGMKLFYSSHMHRYDLCDIPVKFRVRAFNPIDGDVLTRKWIKRIQHEDGTIQIEKRFVRLPAFAMADANATAEIFREYFDRNAVHAMGHVAKHSHPAIREHYESAIAHYHSLPEGDVEKVFMQKFIKLWFCVRFTTGSSYLSGPEKLGCLPVNDPDYPLANEISVPRMITAQCDSIMVSRFLRPLTQDVIPELEKFFRTGNPDNWFMLYVCTFILLAEVSFSCQDRRRHAQENWLKQKYSLPEFVGELQFGANIILCYWHYYRTMDPLDDGWNIFCKIIEPPLKPRLEIKSAKGKGKKKVHLYRSQRDLVTAHWRKMVDLAAMMDTEHYRECFEHPLYFVCQMYMKGWQIRNVYKRGPQEGPEETI